MRIVAVTLLMSSFVVGPGSAQAQAASSLSPDLRCMLTMAALSGSKTNQPQASFGLFYFAGRLKAQTPGFNFATDLKPAAAKMTRQDYEAEIKRCGPMVVSVVQGLQAASTPPPGSAPAAPKTAAPPAKK